MNYQGPFRFYLFVCLISGWHFSWVTLWCDLASCEPSWLPHYLALCDPALHMLDSPPFPLRVLSLFRPRLLFLKGWDRFLFWHQDKHAALAYLSQRLGSCKVNLEIMCWALTWDLAFLAVWTLCFFPFLDIKEMFFYGTPNSWKKCCDELFYFHKPPLG